MSTGKISAGLLMYRYQNQTLEVFLVHPGGPFFAKRDQGTWSIPKGELHDEEDRLAAAKREFTEETGIEMPTGAKFIDLGEVTYTNGKTVYCWAFKNNLSEDFKLKSNPSKFGWPENDRGQFFDIEVASLKILPAQKPFIDKLKIIPGRHGDSPSPS